MFSRFHKIWARPKMNHVYKQLLLFKKMCTWLTCDLWLYKCRDELRQWEWLEKGSPAHKLLINELEKPHFRKSVKKLNRSIHTGKNKINWYTRRTLKKGTRKQVSFAHIMGNVNLVLVVGHGWHKNHNVLFILSHNIRNNLANIRDRKPIYSIS